TRVLPVIAEAFGDGALDHLVDVAPRWRDDEDFLELEAARLFAYASRRGAGGPGSATDLDADALACAHPALRSRVLRRWLFEATGRTSASREIAGIQRWLQSAGGRRGTLDLAGVRLTGKGGRLSLDR
ncbi:MAG: TilS substrate-binding domain-containing protein, partial [Candidatus Binatia bacterium]